MVFSSADADQASRDELIALLEERSRELAEARRVGAVTSALFQVMGRPTFDLGSVLNTLTKEAAELCRAGCSGLFLREGDRLVPRGTAHLDPEQERFVRTTPAPVEEDSFMGRAVLHGTIANIPDFVATSTSFRLLYQQKLGFRSMLVVPLMRGGRGIGVLMLARPVVGAFSEREVSLVRTFAEHAAVAVQTASLIDELQARTDELARSLEQLHETQARLARSERLAALSRLVTGIAHEMNTPIGNAFTVSTTLEQQLDRLDASIGGGERLTKAELTQVLKRLRSGSALVSTNLTRAIDLIQRFQQVSSDRGGGGERRIDVRSWAEGVFRNHGELAGSRHGYGLDVPHGLMVVSFPERWAQIVNALIDNSLQHAFAPDRTGRITLAIRAREPRGVSLHFRDDGRGVAPDNLPRLFEPFYTTARQAGATGLGLHIVHNLVASMGGEVAVASTPGGGTDVTVELPSEWSREHRAGIGEFGERTSDLRERPVVSAEP